MEVWAMIDAEREDFAGLCNGLTSDAVGHHEPVQRMACA